MSQKKRAISTVEIPSVRLPGVAALLSNGNRKASFNRPQSRSPQSARSPTRHVTNVASKLDDEGYMCLNQYRVVEDIAQGSYGIVKLAYNQQDNSLYAMKVLDKKKLMKKFACFRKPPPRRGREASAAALDPLQQVHREIAILKKLSHTNVVRLVEVLDDPSDNYLYMVFEYVECGCLLDVPTTSPLSEDVARQYFRDAILGLEYLHFQKIVHRDIKPSNLLISDTGCVKIADFGVSCEFEGLDAILTGTAGTPAFLAPEALIVQDEINGDMKQQFYSGKAQDIWSLGVTLYAMVYGQVPFHDNFVIALYKKIKTDPLVFPEEPKISGQLRELITRLLTKDAEQRIKLSEIKLHSWVTANGTEPLPDSESNCSELIAVTDDEIANSVRVIPKLDTLILIKAMGQRKSFGNPFRRSIKCLQDGMHKLSGVGSSANGLEKS